MSQVNGIELYINLTNTHNRPLGHNFLYSDLGIDPKTEELAPGASRMYGISRHGAEVLIQLVGARWEPRQMPNNRIIAVFELELTEAGIVWQGAQVS